MEWKEADPLPVGWWVRTRYRVLDDSLTWEPGSKREPYDPVAYDEECANREDRLRLVEHLTNLDPKSEEQILAFASRWGLLGLFQHHLVELAGRMEPETLEDVQITPEGFVGPAVWTDQREASPYPVGADEHFREHFFDPHPLNAAGEPVLTGPFALSIWEGLRESLADFRRAVTEFQEVVWLHDAWQKAPEQDPPPEIRERLRYHLRRAVLVPDFRRPAPRRRGEPRAAGPWVSDWVCPSLLSLAYRLLWSDISRGAAPRLCAYRNCARWFTPTVPQRKYCSPDCGKRRAITDSQRRARARRRASAPLAVE